MATSYHEARASIPDFNHDDPEDYFTVIEKAFKHNGITDDEFMFDITHSKLPDKVKQISKPLIKSNATDKMVQLKTLVLEEYNISKRAKIQKLLSQQSRGQKKPSEFLKCLREIQGYDPTGISDIWVENHFLSSLPKTVRSLLRVLLPDTYTLEQQAKVADNALDDEDLNLTLINEKTVLAVQNDNNTAPSDKLTTTINKIKDELDNINSKLQTLRIDQTRNTHRSRQREDIWRNDYRGRSWSHNGPRERSNWRNFGAQRRNEPGRSRFRSSSRNPGEVTNRYNRPSSNNQNNICFYHKKYQTEARRCSGPGCKYFNPQKHSYPKNDTETGS